MKSFVVFAAVLACAYAKPQFFGYNGLGYAGYPGVVGGHYTAGPAYYQAAPQIIAPAFTKTQYHAQDEFGQASHGYAHPGQAAAEVRDAFGNVRGSYAYVDPNGKEVRVNYVADALNGFRVESNALPVGPTVPETPALVAPLPVQDTPEVVAARAAHAEAVAAAQAAEAASAPAEAAPVAEVVAAPVAVAAAPVPVQDTPEVVEARAAHAVAFQQAAAAAAVQPERRKKRGIVYSGLAAPALTYAAAPAAFGYGYTAVHAPAYAAVHAPAYSYAAAPALAYAAAPVAVAAPAVAFRDATLTKVVNNPGHAVSYRVD